MTELEELKARYHELDKEAGKYNHPEFDEVHKIILELIKDRDDVGDKGNLALPLVAGDIIDNALNKAGLANNKILVSDFLKYREIVREAREIQLKGLNLYMSQNVQEPDAIDNDKWRFCPIRILASPELMPIVDEAIKDAAQNGKGLFSIVTDIPKEDEELDGWFDVEAYGLKCSLEPFYRDLQRYGILDSILKNKNIRKHVLDTLKNDLICFIKNNTDKPNSVRNHIASVIGKYDSWPILGLILQIILLQGLFKWFEGVEINEGDNGFKEAELLYIWVGEQLIKKEISFCYFPYGEKDIEFLQPLCNYLYSTELGKKIQNSLFAEDVQKEKGKTTNIPKKLNTYEAKGIFQRAINVNILDNDFQCIGLTIYQKRRFAELASEELGIKSKWKTFEDLWNIKGLAQVKMYEADQDSLKIIDGLFPKEIIDKAKKK